MIDLHKIETFLCAVEELNISDAAKQFHLSQPTVSHQIKLLEQELGAALFIRSSTGLQLTEAGQLLVPWARGWQLGLMFQLRLNLPLARLQLPSAFAARKRQGIES
jgi:DNA-binding transcriptional ArsR family regulator